MVDGLLFLALGIVAKHRHFQDLSIEGDPFAITTESTKLEVEELDHCSSSSRMKSSRTSLPKKLRGECPIILLSDQKKGFYTSLYLISLTVVLTFAYVPQKKV